MVRTGTYFQSRLDLFYIFWVDVFFHRFPRKVDSFQIFMLEWALATFAAIALPAEVACLVFLPGVLLFL